MKVILLILSTVVAIALGVFLIVAYLTKKRIAQEFSRCNVMVYGKKGQGKDLLFQAIINKRNVPYLANISYGGKYTRIWADKVSVAPNTYENFILDKVKVVEKVLPEKQDCYFSDGGIIFPSQMDSQLHKLFPSYPIYYALSRHLAAANIHINTQNLGRVWKALREQADYYVRCRGVIHLPFFLVIKTTEYDQYSSAEKNLLPLRSRFSNKYSKAEVDQFNATNGFIKNGFVIIRNKSIYYDTRAYHKIIYGCDAPTSKSKRSRLGKTPKTADGATAPAVVPSQLSAGEAESPHA